MLRHLELIDPESNLGNKGNLLDELWYRAVGIGLISFGGDYLYLDKRSKVKGWAIDDGDTVRFFDKSFQPKGWYDRGTNTTFDRNDRPTGTIYDFDRDE